MYRLTNRWKLIDKNIGIETFSSWISYWQNDNLEMTFQFYFYKSSTDLLWNKKYKKYIQVDESKKDKKDKVWIQKCIKILQNSSKK